MKPTAELHWWQPEKIGKHLIINGDIHGDTKERWRDGTSIHTSNVKKIQDHGDYFLIFTLNSIYRLPKDKARTYHRHGNSD